MSGILPGEYFSIAEVVQQVPPRPQGPVHFNTVHRWIKDGIITPSGERVYLEAVRLGGRWLIARQALKAFIAATSRRPDRRTAIALGKAASAGASRQLLGSSDGISTHKAPEGKTGGRLQHG